MGQIRILPERSDPSNEQIANLAAEILEVCDELHGDLISMAVAVAAARVSRACTQDPRSAWELGATALRAGFMFDEYIKPVGEMPR